LPIKDSALFFYAFKPKDGNMGKKVPATNPSVQTLVPPKKMNAAWKTLIGVCSSSFFLVLEIETRDLSKLGNYSCT
jgi:hypothetical protein